MKKIAIFDRLWPTSIGLYLVNDTRYGNSYYGMRTGNVPKLSNGTISNDIE